MKQNVKSFFNVFSIVALIAAIMLLVGFIFSGEAVAAWDGTASTTFASGKGTEASPFVINTQSQMGYFMNQLNAGVTYDGIYIKLNANLDMTGGEWKVDKYTVFAGTFLGNNKTLTMDSNFLGTIATTGKVDWLNLKGSGTLSDPLLCYENNGTIQNCRVRGDVSRSDDSAGLLCLNNTKTGVVINSCGFGSVYGYGDDNCVGWISESEGTIKNCYTVVSVRGDVSSTKYSSIHTGEITAKGSYENCYLSTDAVKNDAAFVAQLNATVGVPGYIWALDSSDVNEGYPVIKQCLSAMTQLSTSADSTVIFHSTSFSATLTASESGCTIYYTLDGSDPTTSYTRKTYNGAFTISGDTVVTSVAYKNNTYGVPKRQQVVQLLGSGTSESPYIISTNQQLRVISLKPDKVYELIRDLDFTNEPKNYQGENWESIPAFSGELRGAGHSITGLTSVTGGLVESNTGTIQELRLINHNLRVSGSANYGAIANGNSGTITRCYVSGNVTLTVTSSNYIGGIAGYNNGTISYCSSSGTIRVSSSETYNRIQIGGIAGAGSGTIKSCYSNMGLYGPNTNHDIGCMIAGIACDNSVYDCRFDGVCVAGVGTVRFAVGSASRSGIRSNRVFNGGAKFQSASTGTPTYYTDETKLYSFEGVKESAYSGFNFDDVWMMTATGPMPQGIMDADGHCMSKYSYSEPTCTSVGSAVSYDILNTGYRETETLPMLEHGYSTVVTAPTCTNEGYTTYICVCGDSYVSDRTDALGHTYSGTPEWSWNGDCENGYTSATAKFSCSCGHIETLSATVSAQTTDATIEAEGQTVYTASVTFKDKEYFDVKTVSIPKIPVFTINGTALSWNDTDDLIYLLYSSDIDDATILNIRKNGGEYAPLYTAIKGNITDMTVDGKEMKSQTFTFEGVISGTYKLVILKPGKYLPKIVEFEVDTEAVELGHQKLWLYGDVNYDGVVDTNDVVQMNRYINAKGSVITTGTADEIAEKIKVCDINGDGVADTNDVVQMNRYINAKGSLFNNLK